MLAACWITANADASALNADGLKCEYRATPLGIDQNPPRLSWLLKSKERDQRQTAYRILAASSPGLLKEGKADLWDSAEVPSNESIHVPYGGKPLASGQRVYWKVRVWDRDHSPSSYSDASWWEMALLNTNDWRATWLTAPRKEKLTDQQLFEDDPAPLFRHEFVAAGKIARARLYVCGLGYYEARLNGQRVGDQVLDPGWTTYSNRVLYSTYDVTAQLKRGTNALGIMLGNGWFNPLPLKMWGSINPRANLVTGDPRFISQLVVDYADGSRQTVVSDSSWKTAPGPILRNSIYLGEVYDARKEQPGWDRPGFDDSNWTGAALATAALGPLNAQDAPPIRVTRILTPVKLTEPKPGVYLFDFGQNFAGWARLRVRGPAGTHVKLRSGELTYPDGTLNGMTAVVGQIKGGGAAYRHDGIGIPKTAWQQDEYILKGDGEEIYTPRFTFHGFRYVEVTGFPGKPGLDALEGLRLNSDVASAGSFECSNPRFNRIQEITLWTELSNLFSVESDCPHREKFGYGGDIIVASEMAILNFDMSRFYAKSVRDLGDAVRPNGGFTETAPFVGIADESLGGKAGPIGWASAQPFLQWQLYRYYGDRALLEENYPLTRRWIAFLQSCARDGILDNGLSDHESLVPKPRALTGTAFYYLNVKTFARIASALGKTGDAAEAETLAAAIKDAFNRKFLQPGTGRYDTATQACQSFALQLGLVPPDEYDRALNVLIRDIVDTHAGHLTTGIFGTKFMLETLTDAGRADVAYRIADQRTFPGWGYMLEQGATTLWEHWELSDNTYSHNHPMFGSISEWFYKALGGIAPTPDAVGCNHILIRPQMPPELAWARTKYQSVRGQIATRWKRANGKIDLEVDIPPGVDALVYVPASGKERVSEGGRNAEGRPGISFVRMDQGNAIFAVASGRYHFSASDN
jgi:alpha-L-rhamnosidase